MGDNLLTPAEYKEQTLRNKAEAESSMALANSSKIEAEAAKKAEAEAKSKQAVEEERLAGLESKRKKTAEEVQTLNGERDTALAAKTVAEAELKTVEEKKVAETVALEELQQHLADLEQAKTDEERKFKSDCKSYDAERQEKKNEIDALTQKIKATIKTHEAKIVDLAQQEEDLVAVIDARTKEADTLEKRVAKFEGQIESLNQSILNKKNEIEGLKKEKLAIEAEIKEAEVRKENAIKEAEEKEAELKKIDDEKFILAQRTAKLDEREEIIRSHYQRAGVAYD